MVDGHGRGEIIIIKRGGDEDEGHHGGAWKIAFADFMTAMMALFLVLWLINAANEETKKSVASYFNPVKLVDRNRSMKGLDDAGGPSASSGAGDRTDGPQSTENGPGTEQAESAAGADEDLNDRENDAGKISSSEPASPPPVVEEPGASRGQEAEQELADPFDPQYIAARPEPEIALPPPTLPAAIPGDRDGASPETSASPDAIVSPDARSTGPDSNVENLKAELERAMAGTAGIDPADMPDLTVVPDAEGILISLTDTIDTPMFGTGLATPAPALLFALDGIAAVLARRTEKVRIHGHTDSRPFRSGGFDNWQLSLLRAQTAYTLLVQRGLPPARFSQVSGFADTRPKTPDAPESAANRRIEILLEASQ